ncbi:MAG: phosphatase PAP2 family protein [Ignavibacteriales bacterium]|nr:phosphatase PAP2 family protein [Ignavibacteriales bacterium]
MTKNSNNRFILIKFIIFSFALFGLVRPIYPQSSASDSSFHPYHVNYWATGGIIIGGLALEKIGVPWLSNKSTISIAELQNLNRNDITPIDRWVLNLDPSQKSKYDKLSTQLASLCPFLPVLTMLDRNIRQDWLDVLMMYLQTQAITNNFYLYSPFGATFQNRLRPVVYYNALGDSSDVRRDSNNRNSLYSGHVASAAAASFFTAKIFCDYHPELGWKKYLVYGAAAIPPLLMSYFRIGALMHFPTDVLVGLGVGAFFGILIPELHRLQDKNILLGVYSSSEATGIAVKWQPNFLK